MAKMRKQHSQAGFSLIEVMIAVAIFAVFIVAFISSQGHNLFKSSNMKKELALNELAEMKINELLIAPPEFRESLTEASAETKTFDDYPEYEYSIRMAKFFVPDIAKIQGTEEGEAEPDPLQARVFEQIKKNLEEVIWQISVTVRHKETDQKYELSSWLINDKAQVNVSGF